VLSTPNPPAAPFDAVYVAYGWEYLIMAHASATSLREHNPSATVTLVTNLELPTDTASLALFDRVVAHPDPQDTNRRRKLAFRDYTSADVALFIDCDTLVLGPIDPIITAMRDYDVAVTMSPEPTNQLFDLEYGPVSYLFPQYNSGVVFARRSEGAAAFLDRWKRNFEAMGVRTDQRSFAKTIIESPDVRILTLHTAIWNCLEPVNARRPVIHHYLHPDRSRRIAETLLASTTTLVDDLAKSGSTEPLERWQRTYRTYATAAYSSPLMRPTVRYVLRRLEKLGFDVPSVVRGKSRSKAGAPGRNIQPSDRDHADQFLDAQDPLAR
jgi:hypothetical protein